VPETLVVDCSVAAKWVLPEPARAAALELMNRYQAAEIALIAPDLLLAEFASLLAKRHRRKDISAEQAHRAFLLMTRCAPRLFDTRPLLPHALELAVDHQISLWDCVYLALAREHNCAFVTADRRLFRGGASRHASIRLLS
jgi:predicted nucleic acid-binding protein